MVRLPRYTLPGQPQHVIQRGNNRSALFESSADYEFFRACLTRACETHRCLVHAYVLMPNHVHLLMTPTFNSGIGKVMQSVGRRYVQRFNVANNRTGTLWEGRYRATVIDSDRYLLTCYRYIELNPVRAGLAARPEEYVWSSHRANAHGFSDVLVTPHPMYLTLGPSSGDRLRAYAALFRSALDDAMLEEIRNSTNKGWALGSERFRKEVTVCVGRRAERLPRGRRSRSEAKLESDPN